MWDDEARYEAAVRRRIRENGRKTAGVKLEAYSAEFPEVVRFLMDGYFGKGDFAELLANFRDQLETFGRLSPKQTAVVQKAIERRDAQRAKFAEKVAEDAKVSSHIGQVGERRTFTVTVDRVVTVDGYYGTMHVNILRDPQGNILVYRGNGWEKGQTLTVKARIKEHGEFQGVKQTVLTRPTVQ